MKKSDNETWKLGLFGPNSFSETMNYRVKMLCFMFFAKLGY